MVRKSLLTLSLLLSCGMVQSATTQKRYYAHEAVHDKHGVIAPWYKGRNGQLDFRVRIAAETMKRYPWTTADRSITPLPEYMYSSLWNISPDGAITVPPSSDWENGDLGQRASYVLSGLIDYYRYSGDQAAVKHLTLMADHLIDHCLTPRDHPWPGILVSVPTKGKPYYKADPRGHIQLDIVAEVGLPLLRAYQMTGNKRWLEAAKQWGDLFAQKCDKTPGVAPWSRYANPEDTPWPSENKMTGGVVFILYFLDELIRLGYTGKDDAIVEARDAGRAYLRDVLLPKWTENDTWGRNYWDWPNPVQAENVTEFACRYMMDNKDQFPNWRNDVRNILGLFLNHTSVDPSSGGEVYSGAWAFPESCACCGRSLWYGPMELAWPWAQYGVEADSEWAREIARRMQTLATYDIHETGVSEDNIDGGFIVNSGWFKIAHPMALKHCLQTIAWLPEDFAPSRENHIVRSTAVVSFVYYGCGNVRYSTFDAPPGTVDVLRLAFRPTSVMADGEALPLRTDLSANGYTARNLSNGDCIVTIRHDGRTRISVKGEEKTGAGASSAVHGYPTGGGPKGAQRLVFGYTGREDIRDSRGNLWRPGTEFVVRLGTMADSVERTWWTRPVTEKIDNTTDPDLYRYGVHAPEFIVNLTVGPGRYYVRIKLAATRGADTKANPFNIAICGKEVVTNLDVAATAGGPNKAVDLVFNGINPRNGVIDIRFTGTMSRQGDCDVRSEAFVQAIEIGPGRTGRGATPVCVTRAAQPENLLANPGFEEGAPADLGASGKTGFASGWSYEFVGPGQSYIWRESEYVIHPDWGLPEPHCGVQAVRTHTDMDGHTRIFQDVAVRPNTSYTASVWVRAVDLRGKGFGKTQGDSAGLVIEQIGSNGKVIGSEPRVEITQAGPYTRLETSFVSKPDAAKVRFVLDTAIACPYTEGHVTYDDAALVERATP
jgi:hypothetical protein